MWPWSNPVEEAAHEAVMQRIEPDDDDDKPSPPPPPRRDDDDDDEIKPDGGVGRID